MLATSITFFNLFPTKVPFPLYIFLGFGGLYFPSVPRRSRTDMAKKRSTRKKTNKSAESVINVVRKRLFACRQHNRKQAHKNHHLPDDSQTDATDATVTSTPESRPFGLLDLPPELQTEIFEHELEGCDSIHFVRQGCFVSSSKLHLVCREVSKFTARLWSGVSRYYSVGCILGHAINEL